MADRRDLRWEGDTFYSESQVIAVARSLGIHIETETDAVFLAYCPFHGNRDTPSFALSKNEGLYICYNPSCNQTGNLMQLIKSVGKLNDFEAMRLIARSKRESVNIAKEIESLTETNDVWKPYADKDDPNYMNTVKADMWRYIDPQLYLKGRGFESDTAKKFELGYDKAKDMVCVPMHDPSGEVEVGAVRRSLKGKVFKNTPGLPTSKTLFNLHRARRTGSTAIVVEASFSAMRLDQCGYPNAVSVLMGHFNERHAGLLSRYFDRIVIMTDFDDKKKHVARNCAKCRKAGSNLCVGHNPGEELGMKIAGLMGNKDVVWAHYGGSTRFPPGIKDPDDMDDETIRHCINNAVTHFEYTFDL